MLRCHRASDNLYYNPTMADHIVINSISEVIGFSGYSGFLHYFIAISVGEIWLEMNSFPSGIDQTSCLLTKLQQSSCHLYLFIIFTILYTFIIFIILEQINNLFACMNIYLWLTLKVTMDDLFDLFKDLFKYVILSCQESKCYLCFVYTCKVCG